MRAAERSTGRGGRGGRAAVDTVGEKMLLGLLGPLDQVPVVAITPARLRERAFDHRTGFLLSQVDGASSLEMIIDVSGMTRVEALKGLNKLIEEGVLKLRRPARR